MRTHLKPFGQVFALLGVMLALMTVLRWVFYAVHWDHFPDLTVSAFSWIAIQGLRFDAMTLTIANAPWIVLRLLPFPWGERPWWNRSLTATFLTIDLALLFLCCADLPFYGFNGKRITRDLLGQADAGMRELPGMLVRYWWATAIFLVAAWILWRRARKVESASPVPRKVLPQLGVLVLAVAALVLTGRGGWQYQGLSPAHAADHVGPAWAPVVTNSAFTFGYSLTDPPLPEHHWFDAAALDTLAPVHYHVHGDPTQPKPNLVLLIVESLGREYVGALNNGRGYTPFIDSLCAHALVMTDAYANAERSNKSMCALLAGIPSFTDDAFMNTAFAGNTVEGLGTRLKSVGYSTAFFHGGLNGEYKFDSFSRECGFDRYYGRDEFGDDRYYDGHWGIYDEEFLQFCAARMNELPHPFCSVVFTLSSHDPFLIPDRWRGHFPKGTQEIHEAIGYTDMALRRFFQSVAKEPWFANTWFVITGDHTFLYNSHPAPYLNPAGRFAVPIILYNGDGSATGTDRRTAQHLDLLPTLLRLGGYSGAVHSFGQDLFERDGTDRALIHLGGEYRLIEGGHVLLFDGERPTALHAYESDTTCTNDLRERLPALTDRLTTELKAVIQRHGEMLRSNTMAAP